MMRSLISPAVLAALFLCAVGAARAEDVTAASRIVEVTVFPGRAEVTRAAAVDLPVGKSLVALEGLPASLFPQSVRVRTAAGPALRIGSVETQTVFAKEAVQAEERRLRQEIEELQDRRRQREDQISALRLKLEFIKSLGREAPKTVQEEIGRGSLAPETWQQAWSMIGDGAKEALDGIYAAEVEQRRIDREIQQKQRTLSQIRTGRKSSVTARIQVEATAPTKLRLALSYQVPGAGWRPLYDARLDTQAETLNWTQIGEVTQRTGEDWTDVQLILSTARPSGDARMPDLDTWFLDFLPQPMARSELSKFREAPEESRVGQAMQESDLLEKEDGEGLKALAPVAEVVASEFVAEYRIAGLAKVAADSAPRKFVIAERDMPATLAVQTVPKVVPLAYLFAEIEHPGEEPWLSGPVSIFRDGGFVGTSFLALLRPGEKRKLSFGVDDKVKVGFRLLEGERSREGLINKDRRVERRFLIELENLHKRAFEVTVLDQLPVSRDERIEVELLSNSTAPSSNDLDDRKGVLAWIRNLEPAQSDSIRFGYAVTYPEKETLPGF